MMMMLPITGLPCCKCRCCWWTDCPICIHIHKCLLHFSLKCNIQLCIDCGTGAYWHISHPLYSLHWWFAHPFHCLNSMCYVTMFWQLYYLDPQMAYACQSLNPSTSRQWKSHGTDQAASEHWFRCFAQLYEWRRWQLCSWVFVSVDHFWVGLLPAYLSQ